MGTSIDQFIAPSEAYSVAYWKRVRPEPFWNMTSEIIPPFACMQKFQPKFNYSENRTFPNTVQPSKWYVQHRRQDAIVWDVNKPNAAGVRRQDPAEFMFNGTKPCAPLSCGMGTEDFPCQVLHDGSADAIGNFTACGPVQDQWYVKSGGSAFTGVCHDAGFSVGGGYMHTIWINRGKARNVSAHGRFTIVADDIATDEYLTLVDFSLVSLRKAMFIEDSAYVTLQTSGLYLVSFHGMLTSSDADNGNPLTIRLSKYDSDEDVEDWTPYSVTRNMAIDQIWDSVEEENVDGTRSAENVGFSGIENLRRGDAVALVNTSGKKITLSGGVLSLAAIGTFYEPETADDTGPDAA